MSSLNYEVPCKKIPVREFKGMESFWSGDSKESLRAGPDSQSLIPTSRTRQAREQLAQLQPLASGTFPEHQPTGGAGLAWPMGRVVWDWRRNLAASLGQALSARGCGQGGMSPGVGRVIRAPKCSQVNLVFAAKKAQTPFLNCF